MVIERQYYLERLIECKHDGYVKIITGIRRCGKSFLLNTLFRRHLLSAHIRPSNIITIELDRLEQEELRDPRKLSEHIRQCIKSSRSRYYILIDEIQMCEEVPSSVEGSNTKITFYDVLNGLLKMPNLDVYVTGSNSRMLSDDVATHFRDRGKIAIIRGTSTVVLASQSRSETASHLSLQGGSFLPPFLLLVPHRVHRNNL